MNAIEVRGLSKKYRLGETRRKAESVGEALRRAATSPFSHLLRAFRPPSEDETLWALRDIDFDVEQGKVYGLIGRNGAGKSTLLKILSRITEPSGGRATLHGRVASLLEVGTGFHGDLTGRENVFLNGTIMGMTQSEVRRKFDEIVAFSGVEKFIDTPVKYYSSGMGVRLGFAVAAHLDPEILVVDEVLAVGDLNFRKKCMEKMEDASRRSGKTILFVSHDLQTVQSLCNQGIYMDKGRILYQGETGEAIRRYVDSSRTSAVSSLEWTPMSGAFHPYPETTRPRRFVIREEDGRVAEGMLFQSRTYRVEMEFDLVQPESRLIFMAAFYCGGHRVFMTDVHDTGGIDFGALPAGPLTLSFRLPGELLCNREYEVECLACMHHVGWILGPDNETRLRFDFHRDRDDNPYPNSNRLGDLAPVFPWDVRRSDA